MKKIIALMFVFSSLLSCNKDDDGGMDSELSKLPPITQSGANTFGCTINGIAFLPNSSISPLGAFYQSFNGEYELGIIAHGYIDGVLQSVTIGTLAKSIEENQTYELKSRSDGNLFGGYFINSSILYTNDVSIGEVKITKITNQFISGTFWYDIYGTENQKYEIRNGRFDVLYVN